jgi:hypothetical protein
LFRYGIAVAACAALCGCIGVSLDSEPSAGASLAGTWRLDAAASDDPGKALDKVIRNAPKNIPSSVPQSTGRRGRRGGQQQGQGPTPQEQDDPAIVGPVTRADVLRGPFSQIFGSDMIRSDVVTIREAEGKFILDYGTSIRRFTPGDRSVVSVPGGVADQRTGWKGRDYVVNLRSQEGPNEEEVYALSADKKRLTLKLTVGGNGFPNIKLTRVYTPASETPRSYPKND